MLCLILKSGDRMVDKEYIEIFSTQKLIFSQYNGQTGFSAWVSPDGVVYWLPGGVDHTSFVCQNPVVFGVAKNVILESGNSSEVVSGSLFGALYRSGWVRIRNHGKMFFITCHDADQAVRVLKQWAEDVLSTGKLKDSTIVSITGMDITKSIETSLGELLSSSAKKEIT